MFTLPPRPPKDFVLKDVTKSLCSSSQFTPDSVARVTQDNLGKYCFPIEYEDDEIPEKISFDIEPNILNKMTKDARACWVVEPGKDDFFLHDVYKKYSVKQEQANYDPRYMHKGTSSVPLPNVWNPLIDGFGGNQTKSNYHQDSGRTGTGTDDAYLQQEQLTKKVFNRSYQYEIDCIEAARLEKLRAKCEREDAEFENSFQKLVNHQKAKEKPAIQVKTCKEEAPFWWKNPDVQKETSVKQPSTEKYNDLAGTTIYRSSYVRWQEEPNLTAFVQDDPCRRKHDMLSVGQPFKTEACNWYYKTYPPPEFEFRPKRFT